MPFSLEFICIPYTPPAGRTVRALILAVAEIGDPIFVTAALCTDEGQVLQAPIRRDLFIAAQDSGESVTCVEADTDGKIVDTNINRLLDAGK